MSQPVVKYTLTKQGRQPDWLSKHADAFKGEHSISANKAGKIPRYDSPQDTIYLGIASGDPDDDGTPDSYVGIITTKAKLQEYIVSVGNEAGYKTVTATVTGVSTETTTGLSTAWGQTEYSGGLSTTTTAKHTTSGVGTVATISTSQVTKVVIVTDTPTGSTTATTDTPVVVDPASTLSGVSTSVGIVTTFDSSGYSDPTGVTTTTTTTSTTSYTYTDVTTSTSTSTSSTTTDGVTTRTDTVTITETTNYETTYDYAAEATRLWDKYEAVNA